MKSIEAIANVSPDGKLTVQLPYDMPPGEYKVVVEIDEVPMVDEFPLEPPSLAVTTTTEDPWEFFNALMGMVDVPDD